MATQKARIETIIAIINTHPAVSATNLNKIKAEFRQVTEVDAVSPPRRRNILKVLHSTRGLDSTLKVILDHYGIRNRAHSIGQYIHQFASHSNTSLSKLSSSERAKYQRSIADIRNDHLHNADSYPRNDSDVYTLVSEMEALLTRIATL